MAESQPRGFDSGIEKPYNEWYHSEFSVIRMEGKELVI